MLALLHDLAAAEEEEEEEEEQEASSARHYGSRWRRTTTAAIARLRALLLQAAAAAGGSGDHGDGFSCDARTFEDTLLRGYGAPVARHAAGMHLAHLGPGGVDVHDFVAALTQLAEEGGSDS